MQRTITAAQWRATHRDYRSTIGHQRYILKLEQGETRLVPVKIVPNPKEGKNHGRNNH